MRMTLSQNRDTSDPVELIYGDLNQYVEYLNTGSFDRVEKLNYLNDLTKKLADSVSDVRPIYEEIRFIRQQVGRGQALVMREQVQKPEYKTDCDQDNGPSLDFF